MRHMDYHTYLIKVFKRAKDRHFLGTTHGTDFAMLRMDPKGMDFLSAYLFNPLQASAHLARLRFS